MRPKIYSTQSKKTPLEYEPLDHLSREERKDHPTFKKWRREIEAKSYLMQNEGVSEYLIWQVKVIINQPIK